MLNPLILSLSKDERAEGEGRNPGIFHKETQRNGDWRRVCAYLRFSVPLCETSIAGIMYQARLAGSRPP